MVSQFRLCQGQKSRRKEHSLVIGMGDQQTYPLIPQLRELRLRYRNSVEPRGDDDEEGENKRYPQHGDMRTQEKIQE